MSIDLIKDTDFRQWLTDLKARIRQSQLKAMIKVIDCTSLQTKEY